MHGVDKLTTEDLKRYIKVLYKENQQLKELLYKASLKSPIDFDGDNFKQEDRKHMYSYYHEIHNSNIGKKFQEDMIGDLADHQADMMDGYDIEEL